LTAFAGVDSQNLPDVMVSVQFILAIGGFFSLEAIGKSFQFVKKSIDIIERSFKIKTMK
jgi:hypothetical protein